MKKLIYPLIFITVVLIFFWKFFIRDLLPIPADTIVGMYHPWRDFFSKEYPNGIPFKNFLITDPVRQQYPWRKLAIDVLKKQQLPIWNPYTFGGTPLIANFQSAVFYPFNLLFFIPKLSFSTVWSILIVLQPVLAGLFLYLYLRHFQLKPLACFLGGISFAFSGFFVAWLEWNTVLHSALWLPLILLSVEKILYFFKRSSSAKRKAQSAKLQLKSKNLILWSIVLLFSLTSSFLAGHLQTFFYVFLTSFSYFLVRILSLKKRERKKAILLLVTYYLLLVIITFVQWLPTLKFINLSAREIDQVDWQAKEGWFIPWQHLIQLLAPDFFGNPTTLNYWGIWNYGELVGYLGLLSLIMALLAMIWRKDKKTLFFGWLFFVSLIFALPTSLAKLPYQFKIPFLSTSQPTRLLFLIDFSLAVLGALGFDYFLKRKSKMVQTIELLVVFGLIYGAFWLFGLTAGRWLNTEQWLINLVVTKRNLILPTGLFTIFSVLLVCSLLVKKTRFKWLVACCLLLVACCDLFRFGWKFTPFTKKEYLFPLTKVIEFLQKEKEPFRFMVTDKRIFPPNFSSLYQLETVSGYDPLYLLRYGELIAASERDKPDISQPFGFNRIITPQNYNSRIMDLLNVKYVLSFDDLDSKKLVKVFEEGKTKVYENKNALPRAFMVYDYKIARDKQEAIELMMDENIDLLKTGILEEDLGIKFSQGKESEVTVTKYGEQHIEVEVKTDQAGILILSDNFYPGWRVFLDGREEEIYQVDYNLRGVVVSKGKHEVIFLLNFGS